MANDSFHVWLARPRVWPEKIRGREGTERHDFRTAPDWFVKEGDRAARKMAGPFTEPAEAADVAEMLLENFGVEDQSWCELRYNGDREPHTMIFLLENGVYGVWNTASARWPIFYPVNEYGVMLEGWPEGMEPHSEGDDEIGDEEGERENDEDDFGKSDEDSKLMDLSNDGSDDEDEDEGAEEDDEAEDEAWEDDEDAEDEIEAEDGDLDDEADEEMSDESDDEIPEDEDDEEGEDEDDGEEEGDDESDEDEESEDDDESENEDEEEIEMPRLNIFAKMRGPKGWRKRADAEDLLERNVFGFKVGVLDPDEEKTNAQREKELVAHVEFIEDDSMREAGILRMKLPTVDVDEIEWKRRGQFIEAVIPYRGEER